MPKTPNILEVDGLIIRGSDGKKRAEIEVHNISRLGEAVTLSLYGNTDMGVPEPAFFVHVDAAGRTNLKIGYAGVDDKGGLQLADALRIDSGDMECSPYIQYFGNRDDLPYSPTYVVNGEHIGRWADFVNAVLEVARRHPEFGLVSEEPAAFIEDIAQDVARMLEVERAAAS